MGRFAKEVDEFVAAFKAGNDIGYRMRYFQLQQRQQQLREMQFQQRLQRGTGAGNGMPADTQELIERGRGNRFGPGSENTTQPSATKQATVQPKKQEIPDATPTAQPDKSSDATPAATTPSSGGGGSTGGEKHASILDKYPGSYQTAALETGTTNDASPVRPALGGVSAPGGGVGGASPVAFGSNSMAMYRALTDLGVKPQVAAGAVGSMMGESGRGLNPATYVANDNGGPSGGALQWHNERLTGLYNFAGTGDISKIPIETQAKYMQQELQGRENGTLKALLGADTVRQGTDIWTRKFERPQYPDKDVAKRTPMGEAFWKHVENGNVASTTPNNRNQDAGNARQQVAAIDTGTKTDASPASRPVDTTPAATTPATTTPVTPASSPAPKAVDAPLPPTRPADLGKVDAPLPPKRPDDLSPEPPKAADPAKEAVPTNAQPGQDALAPAAQQSAQSDGWSFLDNIGRGVDDFFNDLNIPADWDVGSAGGDAGGDFGGIGDAIGGIGDAIGGALGGLFNRGGMVR